jgi:hypothetical protein
LNPYLPGAEAEAAQFERQKKAIYQVIDLLTSVLDEENNHFLHGSVQ